MNKNPVLFKICPQRPRKEWEDLALRCGSSVSSGCLSRCGSAAPGRRPARLCWWRVGCDRSLCGTDWCPGRAALDFGEMEIGSSCRNVSVFSGLPQKVTWAHEPPPLSPGVFSGNHHQPPPVLVPPTWSPELPPHPACCRFRSTSQNATLWACVSPQVQAPLEGLVGLVSLVGLVGTRAPGRQLCCRAEPWAPATPGDAEQQTAREQTSPRDGGSPSLL